MKLRWERRTIVFVLVCSVACLPAQPSLAANLHPSAEMRPAAASTPAAPRDIALQADGSLRGQIVDRQGTACSGITVEVRKADATGRAEAVRTDREGRFQFRGLSGGVYRIQTAKGTAVCRLWAAQAAPPAASSAMLLVHGEGTVRGACEQECGSCCPPPCAPCGGCPIILSPLEWAVIGAGVAAAIAIPLALQHRNDAS